MARDFLSPREAAALLRANGFTLLNVSNLAWLRAHKVGPPYIFCKPDFYYHRDSLMEWMRAKVTEQSTLEEMLTIETYEPIVMGRWHAEHPFDIMTGKFEAKDGQSQRSNKEKARGEIVAEKWSEEHPFDIMASNLKRKC